MKINNLVLADGVQTFNRHNANYDELIRDFDFEKISTDPTSLEETKQHLKKSEENSEGRFYWLVTSDQQSRPIAKSQGDGSSGSEYQANRTPMLSGTQNK